MFLTCMVHTIPRSDFNETKSRLLLYITWEDGYVQVTVDCSVGVYKFGNKGTRSIMCSYLEIYETSEKYVS